MHNIIISIVIPVFARTASTDNVLVRRIYLIGHDNYPTWHYFNCINTAEGHEQNYKISDIIVMLCGSYFPSISLCLILISSYIDCYSC